MIIKYFKVTGLNRQRQANFDFAFNEDLNIFTGKNGSGKTTLLKLLWYLISGNLDKIPQISFAEMEMETDTFNLKISQELDRPPEPKKLSQKTLSKHERRQLVASKQQPSKSIHPNQETVLKIVLQITGQSKQEKSILLKNHLGLGAESLQGFNQQILAVSGSSIFLPTFRRIEGGFWTFEKVSSKATITVNRIEEMFAVVNSVKIYREWDEACEDFSRYLSNKGHRFITAISTNDMINLLTRHYAEISEQIQRLQSAQSQFITEQAVLPDDYDAERLKNVLQDIQARVKAVERQIAELRQPFTKLSELVKDIFQYKGIKIDDTLTLGEVTEEALFSEQLSSGEKQMLSLLCYNALHQDSILFIDEPELSLHVDWQRLLCRILLEQGSHNQLLIATHSPFIYSKFPDKELILDEDKGGE